MPFTLRMSQGSFIFLLIRKHIIIFSSQDPLSSLATPSNLSDLAVIYCFRNDPSLWWVMEEHLLVQSLGSAHQVPINILFLGIQRKCTRMIPCTKIKDLKSVTPDFVHSGKFYKSFISATPLLAVSWDPYGQIFLFRAPGIFWLKKTIREYF